MLKSLADRLAEAFAEWLHRHVRRALWGYARDENARQRGAGARGISRHPPRARLSGVPGPFGQGRPVRRARRAGCRHGRSPRTTRCCRRRPSPASISRIRTARYFAVGKIAQDQLADYAVRSGVDIADGAAAARPEPVDRARPLSPSAKRCGSNDSSVNVSDIGTVAEAADQRVAAELREHLAARAARRTGARVGV